MKALFANTRAPQRREDKYIIFIKGNAAWPLLLLWLQKNHYQQEQDKRAIILAQVVKKSMRLHS